MLIFLLKEMRYLRVPILACKAIPARLVLICFSLSYRIFVEAFMLAKCRLWWYFLLEKMIKLTDPIIMDETSPTRLDPSRMR